MNCSERDRLDAEVAQATLEWTVLDQTTLPDVSIPGGLEEADDLTRQVHKRLNFRPASRALNLRKLRLPSSRSS